MSKIEAVVYLDIQGVPFKILYFLLCVRHTMRNTLPSKDSCGRGPRNPQNIQTTIRGKTHVRDYPTGVTELLAASVTWIKGKEPLTISLDAANELLCPGLSGIKSSRSYGFI